MFRQCGVHRGAIQCDLSYNPTHSEGCLRGAISRRWAKPVLRRLADQRICCRRLNTAFRKGCSVTCTIREFAPHGKRSNAWKSGFTMYRLSDRRVLQMNHLSIGCCCCFHYSFTHCRVGVYRLDYFVSGGFQFPDTHDLRNHFSNVCSDQVAT